MSSAKPVLILGAGLGGLLLAQSLRSKSIAFKLYERDVDGSSRSQGYRLRISVDGLAALEQVLDAAHYERFRAGCTDLGAGKIEAIDALTMLAKLLGPPGAQGGERLAPPAGGDVVGVERAFLRKTLFEGIEDATVFGAQVVGYALQEGGVVARFADGTTSPLGSLLVGADGVRSVITKQLTKGALKVYDTGARAIHGSSPVAAFEGLGTGAFSIRDDTRQGGRIAVITNTLRKAKTPSFGWVLVGSPGSFTAPNDDFSVTGKPAADLSRQLTAHWHDRLRPIFEQQLDDEAVFLKMATSSPDGVPEWDNEPRVTLIGDAVHAMTPVGGVGANTALKDAALLGRLLADAGGSSPGLTAEYEREMRAYASPNVKMSFERASRLLTLTELTKTI
ncbi:MAG TPA: FAD-dependent monooxygenase [Polyangiaceae bacterium]|nr:FAD-dependent monooxygenase [Polyangiaceae bacterium]